MISLSGAMNNFRINVYTLLMAVLSIFFSGICSAIDFDKVDIEVSSLKDLGKITKLSVVSISSEVGMTPSSKENKSLFEKLGDQISINYINC